MTKVKWDFIILFFLYFVGFNCNMFSIKLVKIAQEVDLATWLATGSIV